MEVIETIHITETVYVTATREFTRIYNTTLTHGVTSTHDIYVSRDAYKTQEVLLTRTVYQTSLVYRYTSVTVTETSTHVVTWTPVFANFTLNNDTDPVVELTEITEKVIKRKKQLTKISVNKDKRPSSKYIGYVAVSFLTCVLGALLMFDLLTICQKCTNKKKRKPKDSGKIEKKTDASESSVQNRQAVPEINWEKLKANCDRRRNEARRERDVMVDNVTDDQKTEVCLQSVRRLSTASIDVHDAPPALHGVDMHIHRDPHVLSRSSEYEPDTTYTNIPTIEISDVDVQKIRKVSPPPDVDQIHPDSTYISTTRVDIALPSDTEGQRVVGYDDTERSHVSADRSSNSCKVEMLDVCHASSPASAHSENTTTMYSNCVDECLKTARLSEECTENTYSTQF